MILSCSSFHSTVRRLTYLFKYSFSKKPSDSPPAANFIQEEQQKDKNANKEAYIVVGENRKEQANRIDAELFIPQQIHSSQDHHRQQRKGIQPHNIPEVSERPGAKRIKGAENSNRQIIPIKEFLQKVSEGQSGQAQPQGNQHGKEFQKQSLRHQNTQKIQR